MRQGINRKDWNNIKTFFLGLLEGKLDWLSKIESSCMDLCHLLLLWLLLVMVLVVVIEYCATNVHSLLLQISCGLIHCVFYHGKFWLVFLINNWYNLFQVSIFVKACKDQIDILKNRIQEDEVNGNSTRWLSLGGDGSRADVVAHKHGVVCY